MFPREHFFCSLMCHKLYIVGRAGGRGELIFIFYYLKKCKVVGVFYPLFHLSVGGLGKV